MGPTKSSSSLASMVDGLLITVPFFSEPEAGVQHFFGTRHSRVERQVSGSIPKPFRSPGKKPRQSLLGNKVQGPKALVSVKQVHGTNVLVVDGPVSQEDRFPGGWDALVTNQPGVLLTVRTADCVPVLLFDPKKRLVGAIHAGWRGAVGGIVINALQVFLHRFGSDVRGVRVGIGPSVGPCCYEVDTPVLERLQAECQDWQQVVQNTARGKALLDLKGLIRRQAEGIGVPLHNISTAAACTVCHADLFYSYRREGVVKETMVSGIMLASRANA